MAEGRQVGHMYGVQCKQADGMIEMQQLHVGGRRPADLAGKDRQRIGAAGVADLFADIGDFHDSRLHTWRGHERPEFAASFKIALARQLRQDLVHGHA